MGRTWRARGAFLLSALVLSGIVWGAFSLGSDWAVPPRPAASRAGDAGTTASPTAGSAGGSSAASPSAGIAGDTSPASSSGPTAGSGDLDPTTPISRYDSASPSGRAVPLGDLPGWKQVFADDFTGGTVPLGGFPGTFSAAWSANYFDGTPDTAGQKNGGKSGYYPSKVLSIHNGVLDMYLHSEKGISMGAAPAPKIAGNNQAPYNSQTYGMYSVRFRADALPGFKTAWLLWPDSEKWPADGELDFPEGDLASTFFAALHSTGSTQGTASAVFQGDASFQAWNTATIEWTPGRVEFFLNGRSIGASTSGVPDTPMHYVLQTESCLPTCPDPKTSGHVEVDWVAIWEMR